jgi:hypothetical protein
LRVKMRIIRLAISPAMSLRSFCHTGFVLDIWVTQLMRSLESYGESPGASIGGGSAAAGAQTRVTESSTLESRSL